MAIRSRGRDTLHEMMIWSLRRPLSSASSVDCSAEITMHSLRISSEVRPSARSVFSCIFGDDELLVERAAVDADAHRLAVVARDLADGGELLVAPAAGADVARD